jgi:hypothetical protein
MLVRSLRKRMLRLFQVVTEGNASVGSRSELDNGDFDALLALEEKETLVS